MARSGLQPLGPQLALVFGSSWFDQVQLVRGLRSVLGNTALIGGSTAGEIVPEGPLTHSCAVLLISSVTLTWGVGVGEAIHADPRKAGQQAAFEAVTGATRYLIEMVDSPFVCELFVRSDDAHDRERFRRRERVGVLGRVAFVASAEDMIVTKLRWVHEAHRAKDREDIRNILAVRASDLDWIYLRRWALEHGTATLLDEIRASLPEA